MILNIINTFYKKEIFSYVRKDERGADSLDLFELTMALEEEYDTEIPAEELADIETVGDVIEYLREKGIDE